MRPSKWMTFADARDLIDAHGGALEHLDGKWRRRDADKIPGRLGALRSTVAAYLAAGLRVSDVVREVHGWLEPDGDTAGLLSVPDDEIRRIAEEVARG